LRANTDPGRAAGATKGDDWAHLQGDSAIAGILNRLTLFACQTVYGCQGADGSKMTVKVKKSSTAPNMPDY